VPLITGRPRRIASQAKRILRSWLSRCGAYDARLEAERSIYGDCVDVHALPGIAGYWADTYLRPKLEPFGFADPDQFFATHIRQIAEQTERPIRVVSLGSGNCDTEVRVAALIRSTGIEDFQIECLDINPKMLERGQAHAAANGLTSHILGTVADLNRWKPQRNYHVVMANQSLHHILKLERLFDGVAQCLSPDGLFITSDMIGRNGHQRWPEARAIVDEFWAELPPRYRYNRQLHRQENQFKDWDCSVDGFEGIRAQDILPLLVERFEFDLFIPFANVVDPFIDRGFGHNFDATREWDLRFIDRVHERDEAELVRGHIKPTHLIAAMCHGRPGRRLGIGVMTPESCIRQS
jgi:SAM-dependent methyltransferase